jgi:hypothetical protein
MIPYHPDTDPATIPDPVLASEKARRDSLRRVVHTGGRNGGRPVCKCGSCGACRKRAKIVVK